MTGLNKSTGRFSFIRWLAVFSACFLPGAGHLIVGRYPRGMLLMALAALDIATIVRLADAAGGKHLLLIVYLGMAIPVIYFYGVFDVLQLTGDHADEQPLSEASKQEQAWRQWRRGAVGLMATGMLLLALILMPDKLRYLLDTAGVYGAPLLLLGVSGWLIWRRRGERAWLGRWTSALFTLSVGSLLLADYWTGREDIALIGRWWPALFILLGFELFMLSLQRNRRAGRPSADVSGVATAIVIAVTAYGITQYAELPYRWLDQWAAERSGYGNYGDEKGFSYVKPAVSAAPSEGLESIVIDNPNGKVRVERGNIEKIVVESTVWIDSGDHFEADAAAEQTETALTVADETTIKTTSAGFGNNGQRKPRVNLVVYLPPSIADAIPAVPDIPAVPEVPALADATASPNEAEKSNGQSDVETPDTGESADVKPPLAIQITIVSGDVNVSDLSAPVKLTLNVGDGQVIAAGVAGTVAAKTVNGNVQLRDIQGDIEASARNGSIEVTRAGANVNASTSNGGIHLNHVLGDLEADTKNGEIKIQEAAGSVKADTLNGSIEASATTLGGDWDIVGLVGDVRLRLPVQGNYEMNGSATFGTIKVDLGLPLEVNKKTVRGTVGTGQYRIYVNANSNIVISSSAP
ncbi:DUF4097 family beta strand repeat-containing protein [Paenibacillus sp. MMS18-CY102]|uniref:DUF4097 family beta strand repeat-containing protein n=1 Tax=Paenibacillus sp. MMS18-CY102 TaxID=2682849 RepID=UPI0013659C76|nr:DUF4097 family beta strand repeat-containing protein [Paenibacillus sp. MMS18-CY102]MWC30693.1 hypothetical protein [Paenibacillus sp. MMS18-CY102]